MEMEEEFKCTICYDKYASLKDLEGHWAVHFRHYGSSEDHKANGSPIRKTDIAKELHKCYQCDFKTKLNIALKRHIKKSHVYDRKQIDKHDTPDVDYLKSVKDISVNPSKGIQTPTHECSKCEYKTFFKPTLLRHVRIVHDKIMDHECNLCEYKTSVKVNIQNHIRLVHIALKDKKCPKCDYATCRKDVLTMHVKTVHDKIKDYKCGKCDYATNASRDLTQHSRPRGA